MGIGRPTDGGGLAFGPYEFEHEHRSPSGPACTSWSHEGQEFERGTRYWFRCIPWDGRRMLQLGAHGHVFRSAVVWGERDAVKFIEENSHAW